MPNGELPIFVFVRPTGRAYSRPIPSHDAPDLLGVTPLTASPPPRLSDRNLALLLTKGDPDPEPANHLNEYEREEDSVLKRVAAPA